MTILEAVKAVEHRRGCGAVRASAMTECLAWQARCDCDRDERVAKGIEAAFKVVHAEGEANGAADSWGRMTDSDKSLWIAMDEALAAFTEAAAL